MSLEGSIVMNEKYRRQIERAFDYGIKSGFSKFDHQLNVNKKFQDANTVCFWGAGKFFFDCNELTGIKYDYVCDNDQLKWGKIFAGKRCISINELKNLKDPIVLILVGNYLPIKKQLDDLGIENYIADDIFCNMFDHKYSTEWFKENLDAAVNALELFADDESKEVYTGVICNRIAPHLAQKTFYELQTSGEYFDHGLFELSNNEIMVDAGAFNGDTITEFIKSVGGMFEKVYAFEIDPENFNEMVSKLNKYKSKIEFINKGVWSNTDKLAFSGQKMSAHISNNDSKYVDVVSIDEALKDKKVTFIKMDIEGAELPALDGTRETIMTYLPKLAITVYHHLSDVWRIPLKIKEFNPNYHIYLRHHSPTVFDTVCYAYM